MPFVVIWQPLTIATDAMINTKTKTPSGGLYVVATPIGNLGDISSRAGEVLRKCQIIACESIQRTRILLQHLEISRKREDLIVLNDVHEISATRQVLQQLEEGRCVALVSDAGTPLISDPGFRIVKFALSQGFLVTPIPGACSIAAIASVCPIPLNRFQFLGFIRSSGDAKTKQLSDIGNSSQPTIFFETAKRMVGTLQRLDELGFGNREVFLGRELTKTHEELLFGTVKSMLTTLTARESLLGEFVAVLDKIDSTQSVSDGDDLIHELLPLLKPSQIARVVARLTGSTREKIYKRVEQLHKQNS